MYQNKSFVRARQAIIDGTERNTPFQVVLQLIVTG
jgi:hypothetical protein